MKKFQVLVVLVLICAVLFAVQPTQRALAVTSTCNNISSLNGTLNKTNVRTTPTMTFAAGDMVIIRVDLVTSGTSAKVRVHDLGGDVYYDQFPAIIYYKVDHETSGQFAVEDLNTDSGSSVTVGAWCNGNPNTLFTDGRLNSDVAQAAAVYCDSGSVIVWRVIQSQGYLSLHVSPDVIAKVPKFPAKNTLIAQDDHSKVRLYRLTSGELQINATSYDPGKDDYVFVWKGCETNG